MSTARQIADERLARGEIDAAQHGAIVSALASAPASKEELELTAMGWVYALLGGVNLTSFLVSLFFLGSPIGKFAAILFGLGTLGSWVAASTSSRPKGGATKR